MSTEQVGALPEIPCPCGCGAIVGYPVEFIDGRWVVLPITEDQLRFLASVQHPRIHSESRTLDTQPSLCGDDQGFRSDGPQTRMSGRSAAFDIPDTYQSTPA